MNIETGITDPAAEGCAVVGVAAGVGFVVDVGTRPGDGIVVDVGTRPDNGVVVDVGREAGVEVGEMLGLVVVDWLGEAGSVGETPGTPVVVVDSAFA